MKERFTLHEQKKIKNAGKKKKFFFKKGGWTLKKVNLCKFGKLRNWET